MKKSTLYSTMLAFFFILTIYIAPSTAESNSVVLSPQDFFGFKPGTDRMLFTYEKLVEYLQELDRTSPRLKMVEIGTTPLGKPMYLACLSSAENILRLDELKAINKRLAIDPEIPDAERLQLIKNGCVFVLGTLSMHSGEVGPSQAAPLIAYDLITTTDPQRVAELKRVVYLMMPCHNPDGMDMIVNHYQRYKDTKWDGCSMPGIYHKYVGHDNNRDFVTLSQKDTKAISRVYSTEWYPQVMIEKHQMGSGSVRYFVPQSHDPIAENIDAGLWTWTGIFGSNMINDMTALGQAGVSQRYMFDEYWPGATETCLWKGAIAMLTEAAGVQYATPIYIEPNELRGYGKGLSEYKKSINMPLPWPGGWWRLGNIVEYELSSTFSMLKTASEYKEAILAFRNELCKSEVKKGRTEPPYYYIMPQKQHDTGELKKLAALLLEHGIHVYELAKPVSLNSTLFNTGDIVVPLAQPFRAFVKEVMEKQRYPVRHYTPNGEIIKPYDVTSWSLPLHRGIQVEEIDIRSSVLEQALQPYQAKKENWIPNCKEVLFSVNENEAYKAAFLAHKLGLSVKRTSETLLMEGQEIPAGSFLISATNTNAVQRLLHETDATPHCLMQTPSVPAKSFSIPRIALVESYFHDMDAGWTRFVFDSYHIPYSVIRPGDFERTNFNKRFDLVVFPDADKSVLMQGKYNSQNNQYSLSSYPPEYTKGIGNAGMEKLMTFLDAGGIIISWGSSTSLFTGTLSIKHGKEVEEFQLPFRDVTASLKKAKFYCRGSLLKLNLKKDHPLTLGMQKEVGIFYRGSALFQTSIPRFDMDRRVIGVFPEQNILLSGYIEKEEQISNGSAIIWLKKGKGQLVLFAFQPQFRASTQGSFKLLFNALLLPKAAN